MRKILRTIATLCATFAVGISTSAQSTITMDAETLELTELANPDGQALPGKTVTSSDGKVTLTLQKGDGRSNPTYKVATGTTLSCVNVYAANNSTANGNTMTLSIPESSTEVMTQIKLVLTGTVNANATFTCSAGSIAFSDDKTTAVWTGSAKSVTIATAAITATTSYIITKVHEFQVTLGAATGGSTGGGSTETDPVYDGFTLSATTLSAQEGDKVASKSLTIDDMTLSFSGAAAYFHKGEEQGVVLPNNNIIMLAMPEGKFCSIKLYTATETAGSSNSFGGDLMASEGEVTYDSAEKCFVWTPDPTGDNNPLMFFAFGGTVFIRNVVAVKHEPIAVAAPVFSIPSGEVEAGTTVSVTAEAGAKIYYQNWGYWIEYTTPFVIEEDRDITVKAMVGLSESETVTATYIVSTPTRLQSVEASSATAIGINGAVKVNTAEPTSVEVYDAAGTHIHTAVVDGQRSIALPCGMYLVRIKNTTHKVVVR